MAQTAVGDLVVNLDVNSTKFNEQITHVKRQFRQAGDAANDTELRIRQAFSRQEIAAKKPVFPWGSTRMRCVCFPLSLRISRRSWRAGRAPGSLCCSRAGRLKTHSAALFPRSGF